MTIPTKIKKPATEDIVFGKRVERYDSDSITGNQVMQGRSRQHLLNMSGNAVKDLLS